MTLANVSWVAELIQVTPTRESVANTHHLTLSLDLVRIVEFLIVDCISSILPSSIVAVPTALLMIPSLLELKLTKLRLKEAALGCRNRASGDA